jgi:type II secretory pathway pseudopilin PulG
VELLIAVIVIGILAAAGLAKYQNFAESSRRKTCLFHLQTIESALASWETANGAFSPQTKTAWGYSTRSGRLVSTALDGTPVYNVVGAPGASLGGNLGVAPPSLPSAPLNAVGAPSGFRNDPSGGGNATSGPLNTIIRDDKVWICPSALFTYYGGEIQNVDDSNDVGLRPNQALSLGPANVVGLTGRYNTVVVGSGPDTVGNKYDNSNLPSGWVTPQVGYTGAPAPQVPFSVTICGCYGSYGPSSTLEPGIVPITGNGSGGGPVGANGSTLNRHSARW